MQNKLGNRAKKNVFKNCTIVLNNVKDTTHYKELQ